jgi:enterochelin esterase-like enzyme
MANGVFNLRTRRGMLRGAIFAILLAIAATACEPLAPEANQQVIIVITNTPTPVASASPTALLATPLPTRPLPTPTPTLYIPPTPTVPPCNESEGRVLEETLASTIAENEVPYRLYLPPCFFLSGRRYPYVILLHGSGFDFTQWTDEIGIQTVMDAGLNDPNAPVAPMVLVMPEGGELEELNVFDTGQSFEDFILNELIPAIELNFCVWNVPAGRAIGGISRGGFWALSIALRHPDLFVSVGGHSPFFDDGNAPPENNPLNLAVAVPFDTPLKIYLDIARDDQAEPNTTRLSNLLRNNNVPHTYELSATGGHTNEYWISQARDYLDFYSLVWPKDVAGLPTCF